MGNLAKFRTDFEQVKSFVDDIVSTLDNFVVDADNIKVAKNNMAQLNKFRVELQDKLKQAKAIALMPYNEIEILVDAELNKITRTRTLLDDQVKELENGEKEKKKVLIQNLIDKIQAEKNTSFFIDINEKWLNKSEKITSIQAQVENEIMKQQIEQLKNKSTQVVQLTCVYSPDNAEQLNEHLTEIQRLCYNVEIVRV